MKIKFNGKVYEAGKEPKPIKAPKGCESCGHLKSRHRATGCYACLCHEDYSMKTKKTRMFNDGIVSTEMHIEKGIPVSQHTPTIKYRVKATQNDNVEIIDEKYNTVAKMTWYPDGLNVRTAHEFVRAVNNHQPLLDAIMEVCKVIGVNETHLRPEQAEALRALAKAHDIAKAESDK